ncbi:hypothetical protein PG997_010793 [Apiospora hydei]|uniref:Uncharacterized protein n=1 Tax=Apiospora hydei TaxID=1337664 RepID=A0ABR1VHB3_9PEZI
MQEPVTQNCAAYLRCQDFFGCPSPAKHPTDCLNEHGAKSPDEEDPPRGELIKTGRPQQPSEHRSGHACNPTRATMASATGFIRDPETERELSKPGAAPEALTDRFCLTTRHCIARNTGTGTQPSTTKTAPTPKAAPAPSLSPRILRRICQKQYTRFGRLPIAARERRRDSECSRRVQAREQAMVQVALSSMWKKGLSYTSPERSYAAALGHWSFDSQQTECECDLSRFIPLQRGMSVVAIALIIYLGNYELGSGHLLGLRSNPECMLRKHQEDRRGSNEATNFFRHDMGRAKATVIREDSLGGHPRRPSDLWILRSAPPDNSMVLQH